MKTLEGCILFDWGDTLMRDIPGMVGPMALWPEIEIMPHAVETLSMLKPHWQLALATGAADSDEEMIRLALSKGGIDGFIDRIFCFKSIGLRKSDPGFYEHIINVLGIDKSRIIMVGDSLAGDVKAANCAGLKAVWFNWRSDEKYSSDNFQTIHYFHELPQAIHNLKRQQTP
jgi:putative hydrolase of the HAD superfamily